MKPDGQADPVPDRKPRSGTDLPFETVGDRHFETGRHEHNPSRLNHHLVSNRGAKVHAGSAGGHIGWQREAIGRGQPANFQRQRDSHARMLPRPSRERITAH